MTTNSNKKQLYSIDVLRFIACLSVVIIHYGKHLPYAQEIHAIVMYAVPLFYIISGYFLCTSQDIFEKRIIKSIIRIGKLFIISGAVLIGLNIVYYAIIPGSEIGGVLSYKNIIRFFVLDDWFLPIGGPMWYLHALIYGYCVIWILFKLGLYKYKQYIAIICLILNAVFTEFFGLLNMGRWIPEGIVGGNFLFRAVPFLIIGLLIHENEEKINSISRVFSIALILVGLVLTIIELYWLKLMGCLVYEGYFQGNMLLAIGMFLLFLRNYDIGKGSLLCKIGKEYSLGIYLVHQPVGFIIGSVLPLLKMSPFFAFIVFILSLIITVVYKKSKL